MSVLDLPDDVLWLVLREVIYSNTRDHYILFEYREGSRGYYKTGPLAFIVSRLAHTHQKFRRCIRRRCIWHKTNFVDGWDFIQGSFTKYQITFL